MKRFVVLVVIGILITGSVFADVVKKTKIEVSFKDFGKFTSEQSEKLTSEKKLTDSKNKFKGKGIVGNLSGKFFLKSGETGEMIVLPEMMIYRMNHKKKEYRIEPIEKITSEEDATEAGYGGEVDVEEDEESEIKIIRSEFTVDDTGESKTINNFSSSKYIVNWLTEWENVRTGEKGTDHLVTDVWTTPLTGDLQKARDEEQTFTKAYMKSIGIDADSLQQTILGTNWLALLGSMSEEGQSRRHKGSNFADEMNKIEGYPVIIDGKYFAKREGGAEEEEADEDSGGGVKGMLGGLAKKALKKGSKNENEPAFTYYTELIEFSPFDVGDDVFQVPANYKKKG
ncbi:MAG: hypothetical protein JSV17_18445 [Candidatus Aminicenantes bacterium]|nr:MAG: hypothetical protein JSV17_18445 [Candidatus Aminicenantes bacterium]